MKADIDLRKMGAMETNTAEIVRRRVKIDFDSSNAGDWSRRSKEYESRLNVFSFILPTGERYFINSVRNYMGKITDPVLRDQSERFIYQEAMHSKEHDRSNEALKRVHPYGAELERISEVLLSFSRRFMPKSTQLATSCGLEHFTAMFADSLLRGQDRLIAEADPAFAALWLWHAVEEIEHKAVCFDVYQQVCGKGVFSYLHRVGVMAVNSLIFVGAMGIGYSVIRWKQRKARGKRTEGRRLDGQKSGSSNVFLLLKGVSFQLYLDYYRPSFHPWNHNNADLIEAWKRNYAGFGVREDAPLAEMSV